MKTDALANQVIIPYELRQSLVILYSLSWPSIASKTLTVRRDLGCGKPTSSTALICLRWP